MARQRFLRVMAALVTFALAVAATVTLVAPNPAAAEWKGQITIWDYPTWRVDGDHYAWIKERIAEFQKTHPGVTFKLVEIPWQGGPEKLDVAVQSGNYPDLARGPLRMHYIAKGVVEPVESFLTEKDRADYLENALDAYTVDGHLYGFPFYMTSMTMLLNLDIFAERGVQPPKGGVWTWDEFLETVKKLSYDKNGDGRIDVYGFGATAMPPDNQHLWPFLYATGARVITNKNQFGFNSERAISALERLQSLTTNKNLAVPFAPGYGEADVYRLFKQGKLAILPIGAWAIQAVRDDVPGMKVGVAYYPVEKEGQKPANTGAVSAYYIFKQENKEKLKVIAEFARTITGTSEQKKLVNYGTFATRRSAQGIYAGDPAMTMVEKGLGQVVFLPAVASIDNIVDQVSRQLQLVLLGRKTPAAGMADAEKAVERILASER